MKNEWIGVVRHDFETGKRIGETLINLNNVTHIEVCENLIWFNGGEFIKVNKESIKMLLDVIKTI